ncbi:MAG: hypothetical protein AB1846_14000, partial [Chloroflexota bacterium]
MIFSLLEISSFISSPRLFPVGASADYNTPTRWLQGQNSKYAQPCEGLKPLQGRALTVFPDHQHRVMPAETEGVADSDP